MWGDLKMQKLKNNNQKTDRKKDSSSWYRDSKYSCAMFYSSLPIHLHVKWLLWRLTFQWLPVLDSLLTNYKDIWLEK